MRVSARRGREGEREGGREGYVYVRVRVMECGASGIGGIGGCVAVI
jgi:hypothetical protein